MNNPLDFLFSKPQKSEVDQVLKPEKDLLDVFDLEGYRWVLETRKDLFRVRFLEELKKQIKGGI